MICYTNRSMNKTWRW